MDADTKQSLEYAFPKLTEDQMRTLEPLGEVYGVPKGREVWAAGTANVAMYVVVCGSMRVLDPRTRSEIAVHHAGDFSGDIDVMNGRPTVAMAEAGENLEVIRIPGECVRTLVGEQPEIGEIVLRAFLLRRAIVQASGEFGVLVVGSRYSPDTLRIREFLTRSRYPVRWEDLEANPDAKRTLEEFEVCEGDTPLVVLPSGTMLKSPSTVDLAQALGVLRPIDDETVDLVIVGAGPAGLAAAVYGASEGLSTLLVDAEGPGGQAGTSSRIENYMGFPLGISGQDLADGATIQAEKFGARLVAPATATRLTCEDAGLHEIEVEGVGRIVTRCVVLATGARYRRLEVDREDEFEGRGVYYAATVVERILCSEAPVAVVGAGNSAGQAAVFMAENAGHVFLVVRGDDLRKSMSSYLALRIEGLVRDGRVSVLLNTEVCALEGETSLVGATLRDRSNGTTRREPIEAIFVMIGAVPRTEWLVDGSKVALDEKGFVLTGTDLVARGLWRGRRPPRFLETSCPGVFAVGDTRSGSVKRVASSVGEGSMAIALVHEHLAHG